MLNRNLLVDLIIYIVVILLRIQLLTLMKMKGQIHKLSLASYLFIYYNMKEGKMVSKTKESNGFYKTNAIQFKRGCN